MIHERTVIRDNVKIYQGVTLGRADTHLPPRAAAALGHIEIGDRALIGANACVLFRSGEVLRIGQDAVVGANSVVLRSIPAGEIWAGNPARRVSSRRGLSLKKTPSIH